MNRNCIESVFISLVFVLIGMAEAAEFAGGTGEPNDPYLIATAEQLVSIGAEPNLLDKHYVLICDIDLDPCQPGGRVFEEAIIAPDLEVGLTGFQGPSFSGALDGQGHSIKNLTIDIWSSASVGSDRGSTPQFVGLFGEIASGALVNDLRIVDANVCGQDGLGVVAGQNRGSITRCSVGGRIQGRVCVGGVTGFNHGTVSQCVNTSTLTVLSRSGGIAGHNEGSVADCYCSCAITGPGDSNGGLVGENSGCLTDCRSYVTIEGGEYVGGLAGLNEGELSHCVCVSTVGGEGYVGGLIGFNEVGADVLRCTSACGVSGEFRVGGACGLNWGTLKDSSSTGRVRAEAEWCGGFVGCNMGTILACRSHSGVTGDDYVGGFSGADAGTVMCCYSLGVVNGHRFVGGFSGALGGASHCYSACVVTIYGAMGAYSHVGGFSGTDGEIVSCFWDIESSRIAQGDQAEGVSTAQMWNIQTYLQAGWDFVGESNNGSEDTWVMSSGEAGYPKLAWE